MARARNPLRDEARALWEADKERPLASIAAEIGVPDSRIRKWKCEDKWENGTLLMKKERSVTHKIDRKILKAVEENEKLTDKEKAFCSHFAKQFNASAAARAAGYDPKFASRIGWELLQKPHIRAEVDRLKQIRNKAMLAGADDLVELHMRIAFADITEYVSFGREEVPVMNMFGPIEVTNEDGEKVTLTKEINTVRFAESANVDGQLISKVKQGKDGASVELRDSAKSMAFLERYFSANPLDRHKMAYDNARLELERIKVRTDEPAATEQDGFMDALKAETTEVWADEAGDIPI